MVRLFVIDIDGCLRPAGSQNPDELVPLQRIQRYVEMTFSNPDLPKVCICSGREQNFVQAILQAIGVPETWSVCENGCYLFRLKPSKQIKVIPGIDEKKWQHVREAVDQVRRNDGGEVERGKLHCISIIPPQGISLVEYYKKVIAGMSSLTQEKIIRVSKTKVDVGSITIVRAATVVDITPKEVDKAAGVRFLSDITGISVLEMVGIGDSGGDLPFLEIVGHAACPANATDEVKDLVGRRTGYVSGRDRADGAVDIIEHYANVSLPHPELKTLSQIEAIEERETFKIIQVKIQKKAERMIIEIPQDPPVATNSNERKIMEPHRNPETPYHEGLWRWPAGGALLIIRIRTQKGELYCALIRKDEEAFSYHNYLTIGAGLGSGTEEFLYPNRTAVREATEEIIIATHKWVGFPWWGEQDSFGGINLEMEKIGSHNLDIANKFIKPEVQELRPLDAGFVKLKGKRKLEVRWRNMKSKPPGTLYFDPSHSAVDFLTAIKVKIPCSLDDLILLDGEIDRDEKRLLDRCVYLYKLERKSDGSLCLGENIFKYKSAVRKRGSKGAPPLLIPYVDYILTMLK